MIIYDLLVGDRVYWVNFLVHDCIQSGFVGSLNILRVSKQVHSEAQKALRVRTLRIQEFSQRCHHLLPQVPQLIAKWTSFIEKLLVTSQFGDYLIPRNNNSRADLYMIKAMNNLRNIVLSLPKLRNVTISERDASHTPNARQLEQRLREIASQIALPLSRFSCVMAKYERSLDAAKMLVIELKFIEGDSALSVQVCVPLSCQLTYQETSQTLHNRGKGPERKVLLDVIDVLISFLN